MVSRLSGVEPHRLQAVEFGLGAAFRAVVEVRQFYYRWVAMTKVIGWTTW
jgi:hypothetical protein